MKSRPRRIENRVAEIFNAVYSDTGMELVERIPVLGRTGPDITYNEMKLIVDVKSRKAVPKKALPMAGILRIMGPYYILRLNELPILSELKFHLKVGMSVQVDRWFKHMQEWQIENEPEGITALVLHRPGMPVGNSGLVVYGHQIPEIKKRLRRNDERS